MITMALESVGLSARTEATTTKVHKRLAFEIVVLISLLCKPAGVLVLRSLAVSCNHLSSVVLYVLRRVPAIRRHCRQISQISPKEFPGISLSPNTLELGFHTRPRLAFLNMEQDIAFPFLLVSSEIYSLSFLD